LPSTTNYEKRAIEFVENLLELTKSILVSGKDVLISGFGKFLSRINEREYAGIRQLVRI
jgi:nucleoid DNA-binding protein